MARQVFRPTGMNNVAPAHQVGKRAEDGAIVEMSSLVNVDPFDAGGVSMRPGRTLMTPALSSHSGWGNGREAYYVEGTALRRFWPGGGTSLVRLGMPAGERCVFCQVNDVIAYSTRTVRGIIENGAAVANFVPIDPFKEPMVPGQCLFFFNGRLYAANGKTIYCSDTLDVPGWIESMDTRSNVVANFDSEVQMALPVDGGFFASDENNTYFFSGADIQVEGFVQRLVANCPAIYGTGANVSASTLGIQGIEGNVAVWTSDRGIFIGTPDGRAVNVSAGTYSYAPGEEGAAIVREQSGKVIYLSVLRGQKAAHNPQKASSVTVTTRSIT
jgi:hypothetical protein